MATVYLIVWAAVISVITAGAGAVLPDCKDCEICVGVIPLRPGGCTLPLALSPKYDTCPAAAAPVAKQLCPCIADLTAVNSVDLVTGMKVAPTINEAGVVNSGSTNPVAVFSNKCRIQAVISADGSIVACDPVTDKGSSPLNVQGLCAGNALTLPNNYLDESGYLQNFVPAQFTASGCAKIPFPLLPYGSTNV